LYNTWKKSYHADFRDEVIEALFRARHWWNAQYAPVALEEKSIGDNRKEAREVVTFVLV
jgi:hypothetical protein